VSDDWMDRAALATGGPLTRAGALRLAAAAALAFGPLGAFLRTDTARGQVRTECSDCLDRQDRLDATARNECLKRLYTASYGIFSFGTPLGLAFSVGCVGAAVASSWNSYHRCRTACGLPATVPPPSPPAPPPPAPGGPCNGCSYYCSPCPSVAGGYICCIYPPKDGKSPCCP
jgi:hypothetical protein